MGTTVFDQLCSEFVMNLCTGVKVDPNQVFSMPAAMVAPPAAPPPALQSQPMPHPQPVPQGQPPGTEDGAFTIPQTITNASTTPAAETIVSASACCLLTGTELCNPLVPKSF